MLKTTWFAWKWVKIILSVVLQTCLHPEAFEGKTTYDCQPGVFAEQIFNLKGVLHTFGIKQNSQRARSGDFLKQKKSCHAPPHHNHLPLQSYLNTPSNLFNNLRRSLLQRQNILSPLKKGTFLCTTQHKVNPYPQHKILDQTKVEAFADDKLKVRKIVQAISPFPTMFSKGFFVRLIKRCHCVGMG